MHQMLLKCFPLILLAVAAGGGQTEVKVFRVPKTEPHAGIESSTSPLPPNHPDISATHPKLTWTVPQGWEEAPPGEMRVASFRVRGSVGKQADVSIIPLGGLAGGDLANVNRWRSQLGLASAAEADLSRIGQAIQIGGQSAQLFDQSGTIAASGEAARILGAIQHRGDTAWFFKMSGDEELVRQQKTLFIEFLKSLKFPAASSEVQLPPSHPPIDATAVAPSSKSSESKPKWQVPAGWKEISGGQFLVAKFLIRDNGEATVNVSMSTGNGGGAAANINRWRGQLGLQPLSEVELGKQTRPIELPTGKAVAVDLTGTDARTGQKSRLVAIIAPQADSTWFYKLMGTEELVGREKAAFTKFVQTATYQ